MQFSQALHKGRLIKRYNRFLADVILEDGSEVTAHCPNTGSMKTCYTPDAVVWLSHNDDPARKLKWTWEFTQTDRGLIGINTARPNQIVAEGIQAGKVKSLRGYDSLRKEVKYGKNSRIDILLESQDQQTGFTKKCYVEVKNTTLLLDDSVAFPDAVTERGKKHLEELMDVVQEGHRAVMLFFVNRPEGDYFSPADDIDHDYGQTLREAANAGVELLAIRAQATTTTFETGDEIPIKL